jgi:predicted metalloendopeptidase
MYKAFFCLQHDMNSLAVGIGIATTQMFDRDWPAAFNYGTLGQVIAHEMGHAFDDNGVEFDANGLRNAWFDRQSMSALLNMTRCLSKQYDQFCPPDTDATKRNVSARQTTSENLADNAGS